MLMHFLSCGFNVGGPGQIGGDSHIEELKTLDSLYFGTADIDWAGFAPHFLVNK